MIASRPPDDPGVREFAATIESVDGREIVLDETYFYPESSEQPADRDPDTTLVVDAVTDMFSGGGGGAPTFAQAGGLDAEPNDVVTWPRER
ncbi:hypothetical protein [Halorubrum laminariae]|uniref:Alanyl-tRNA synthetase class IIc N-terminal domain-containing protein n=1 Tax=Halorubrum laminariae TaxID=1433523 RepID=A0ABD6C3H0_9EURY|nr:hypothetical protein [Halorubrum laminariae]